jgi:hypothetical protein
MPTIPGSNQQRGCNSLPAELKVQIFWFNLKVWHRVDMSYSEQYPLVVKNVLLPHLRMTLKWCGRVDVDMFLAHNSGDGT